MTYFLKRFSLYLDGDDKHNIHQDAVLRFPEYTGHPLVPRVLKLFIDKHTKKINAEKFVYFLSALSSKTSIDVKRKGIKSNIDT